jgi:hypothetical protein
VNHNWIIHMQKEWHIVSKSGLESRWNALPSQGRVMAHIGAIYVKGVSRVIAARWDYGSSRVSTYNHRGRAKAILFYSRIDGMVRVQHSDKSSLVEPCFAIVGHESHVYFAYVSEERDAVHILRPEVGPLGLCETRSVSGIFRALRLWRNVIRYGRYGGSEGFWGGFMEVVLQRLAGDTDGEHGAALASMTQPSDEGIYLRPS